MRDKKPKFLSNEYIPAKAVECIACATPLAPGNVACNNCITIGKEIGIDVTDLRIWKSQEGLSIEQGVKPQRVYR